MEAGRETPSPFRKLPRPLGECQFPRTTIPSMLFEQVRRRSQSVAIATESTPSPGCLQKLNFSSSNTKDHGIDEYVVDCFEFCIPLCPTHKVLHTCSWQHLPGSSITMA
ncbi:uncharacterized protein LOC144312166 isoform X2 [Canis aureus]